MGFREKLVKLSEINQHRADQLEAVRRTWVQEVNALYKAITEDWFDEYMKEGYVTVEHRELQYAESEDIFLGTYMMVLNFGGGVSAVLEPIGTNVIGAFGKIELYLRGHKDKYISLLLIREEGIGGFHWEVWKNRKQRDQILFDRKTFEEILDEWLERLAKV